MQLAKRLAANRFYEVRLSDVPWYQIAFRRWTNDRMAPLGAPFVALINQDFFHFASRSMCRGIFLGHSVRS